MKTETRHANCDVSFAVCELGGGRLRLMISGWAAGGRAQLRIWRERGRNREYLRTASDLELRHLRMSRFEAQCEAAKSFWQP